MLPDSAPPFLAPHLLTHSSASPGRNKAVCPPYGPDAGLRLIQSSKPWPAGSLGVELMHMLQGPKVLACDGCALTP